MKFQDKRKMLKAYSAPMRQKHEEAAKQLIEEEKKRPSQQLPRK